MDEQQPLVSPPAPDQPTPPTDLGSNEVGKGFGIIWLWNLGHLAISGITFTIGIGIVLFCGFAIVQLAYVIPLVKKARKNGLHERAKGMIIGASVSALLSAACYGVLIFSLAHANFH
jgi:hypothetical protein